MFNENNRKQEKTATQVRKIEEKIRKRMKTPQTAQAGLYLEKVIVNPANKNQFLACFDTYDKRDNQTRKNQFLVPNLAEDLSPEDIDLLIAKALGRCNQDLIAIFLPSLITQN